MGEGDQETTEKPHKWGSYMLFFPPAQASSPYLPSEATGKGGEGSRQQVVNRFGSGRLQSARKEAEEVREAERFPNRKASSAAENQI